MARVAIVGPVAARLALVASVAAASGGCMGLIGEPGLAAVDPARDGGGVSADAAGPASTARDPLASACRPADAPDPGPLALRRLTNSEYETALGALVAEPPGAARDLPVNAGYGFDNVAELMTITPVHASHYRDVAERVARDLVASPARRAAVVGCDPTGAAERDACVRAFVTRFVRRAYRRPADPDDVAQLTAMATAAMTATDAWPGVALVVQAVLQSPRFLFRAEVGAPDPARAGLNRLDGFDLASRLAFTLWGGPPDDGLLDAAERGELDTPEGLARTATAMLERPAARDGMRRFAAQWFHLDGIDAIERDAAQYPRFSPALRAAMREETTRFLDDLLLRPGADYRDLLDAPYSFVNAELAALYGVPAPRETDASGFGRVAFGPGDERAGLLTQAGVLAMNARSDGLSILWRGKYVRDAILCDPPPPPPANVPAAPEPRENESEVERLSRHRTDPACAGCHRMMDPLGQGFLRYDPIGAARGTDAAGRPVDARGELFGFEQPAFDGPFELAARLRAAPQVTSCAVRHAFRYAFGRIEQLGASPEGAGDACALAALHAQFARAGYNFRALWLALVRSDAFRYGRPARATEGGM